MLWRYTFSNQRTLGYNDRLCKIKLGLTIGEQVSRATILLFHRMHTYTCTHTHAHGRTQAYYAHECLYRIFTRDSVLEG